MLHDSLVDQLRRIGVLPAIAITIAAALGTFALLERVIPLTSKSAAPGLVAPAGRVTTPITSAAPPSDSGATASDPLAASQASTERSMTAGQQFSVSEARKQAQREAHFLATQPGTRPPKPTRTAGRLGPTPPTDQTTPGNHPAAPKRAGQTTPGSHHAAMGGAGLPRPKQSKS